MLYQKIKEEIKEAMKARNSIRLNTLRGLLAAFTNELVAKGRKPQEELGDDEIILVLKRLAKQRKESIEQFRNGSRNDLAEVEEKELEIIKTFLPSEIGAEQIEKIVLAKKEELGITEKGKVGILIGAVMKELKGGADGKKVKEIVDGMFS